MNLNDPPFRDQLNRWNPSLRDERVTPDPRAMELFQQRKEQLQNRWAKFDRLFLKDLGIAPL